MNCEHDWQEREPGREEHDAEIDDGFVELVCIRCNKYQVVRRADRPATVQGKEQG